MLNKREFFSIQKQDFKNVAKNTFSGKTLDVLNKQIDDFYVLENQIFNNKKSITVFNRDGFFLVVV
jgi:hypothetical protein